MKKLFNLKALSILLLVLSQAQNIFAQYGRDNHGFNDDYATRFQREFVSAVEDIERGMRIARENEERKRREEKEQKINQLSDPNLPESVKLALAQQLGEMERASQRSLEVQEKIGAGLMDAFTHGTKSFMDAYANKMQAAEKLKEVAVQAESDKNARIAMARETTAAYLDALKDGENLKKWTLAAGGAAGLIFGAWHGLKLGAELVRKYYGRPTLAQETSLLSYKDKLVNYFSGKELKENIKDVILTPELETRVSDLATSIKNAAKENLCFKNLLFYGLPGTGKTMLAQRIARSSGLDYVYFSGSDLDKFSEQDALNELTALFDFAENSSSKLMIIIDEAELVFANRYKPNLSDRIHKTLNLLLTRTGTENSNYFVVALTNIPEDLDFAFRSRCDEMINIPAPTIENRSKILNKYIKEQILDFKVVPSLINKFRGQKEITNVLKLDKAVTANYLANVAVKLDNFVGRDIFKLVVGIRDQALLTKNGIVTRAMIDKIVAQKLKQKNEFKNLDNKPTSQVQA